MSMYEDILCSFDNIVIGYKKAHRQKSGDSMVIDFDNDKVNNLRRLQQKMKKKQWSEIFKYYTFIIKEPKERIVDALEFEGRIIQHVLCDEILKPYFEKRLIYQNCACRENKGTVFSIKLLKKYMNDCARTGNKDAYALKMDIRKYFPSIDRTILKEQLKIFPDKEIRELLFYIVDNAPGRNGIPIGNQSSQWFAMFYLNKFDRIVTEKFKLNKYVRYMDDAIVICNSKEQLIELLTELRSYIQEYLHIDFNGKTQIFPIKMGVTFLGWKFRISESNKLVLKVAKEKRKLRMSKIREVKKKFRVNKITPKQYISTMRSVIVNLNIGNTHKMQVNNGLLLY